MNRPEHLVEAGLVRPERLTALEAVAGRYAIAITPAMAELIEPGDVTDPIALQFVPDAAELQSTPEERADPIGDGAHSPVPGIVHRYPDRVLLKLVHACPVYCRFCFRREMVGPGGENALAADVLDQAIAYVAADPGIVEVVVTGGDPLILAPRRLRAVVERLGVVPHLEVIRWHTRVPVVAPERISQELVSALRASGKAAWVALHANHPREFTPEACAAIARLVDAGIPMVSQSVLLAGVNDDVATLTALMRAFVRNRVKPYYLHHPDLAPGTARFRMAIDQGQALAGSLWGHISGLCQPTYVLDIPGGHGKVPLRSSQAERNLNHWTVEDFRGRQHEYPPCPAPLDP